MVRARMFARSLWRKFRWTMADPQYEQFRKLFDQFPQHIKAPNQCYRLTHDLTPDANTTNISPSSCESNEEFYYDLDPFEQSTSTPTHFNFKYSNEITSNLNKFAKNGNFSANFNRCLHCQNKTFNDQVTANGNNNLNAICTPLNTMCKNDEKSEDDQDVDFHHLCNFKHFRNQLPPPDLLPTKPRRKLPEIPKDKKPLDPLLLILRNIPSLAEEMNEIGEKQNKELKQDSLDSIEDLKLKPFDTDSGTSTTHSPLNPGSVSSSPLFGISTLELLEKTCRQLEPTHHVLHKFIPRHSDELELEIGDPVYVQKEADDLWCEGMNLRSCKCGIFPAAHIVDVEYADFDPELSKIRKERFLLDYLGSVKVSYHKGNHVLCQAVRKIVRLQESLNSSTSAFPIILEIGEQGVRMLDRNKPPPNHVMTYDYFYNLKNISFCGYHPNDQRYFGFITKHPVQEVFACHVFKGEQTTRDVTDAVGRAFHRFYDKFLEAAFPIEDIYIE